MSATAIDVRIDVGAIEAAFDEAALKSAQRQLALRIGDDSNKYCKWDTGATWESMRPNSDFDEGTITWATPYASEAYNDPAIGAHPTVPNGKTDPHPRWFEVAKSNHLQQWVQLARKLLGGS